MKSVVTFAIMVLSAGMAYAQTFSVKGWIGGPVYQQDGRFSYCRMSTIDGRHGTELVWINIGPEKVWLMLKNPGWALRKRTRQARFVVNGKYAFSGIAVFNLSGKGTDVLFTIQNTPRIRQLIRYGHTIHIKSHLIDGSYPLFGTAAAFAKLDECYQKYRFTVRQAAAPSPQLPRSSEQAPRTPQESAIRPVSRKLRKTRIAQVLHDAGFRNIEFLPPKRALDADSEPLIWVADGNVAGYLEAYNGAGNVSLQKAASIIIGRAAARCAGKFASLKKEGPLSSTHLSRVVITSCATDKGLISVRHTLTKFDSGKLVFYGVFEEIPGKTPPKARGQFQGAHLHGAFE